MKEKERLEIPDIVKGLAVVLMVQVHLTELFVREDIYKSAFGIVSLFWGGIPAAPVFMVMMGYFLAFGKKSSSDMAKRGIRLFIGGIVLNIGLNAHLLYNIMFKGWEINPWHYIFGVDILTLAGLSLISFALVKTVMKNEYWQYLILALVIAAISNLFTPTQFEAHPTNYVLAFLVGGTSWAYFPLIPWLAYPLLGYGFKLLTDKIPLYTLIQSIWIKIMFGVIAVILIYSLQFGIDMSTNLSDYYHHDLLFFLWSTGFIILWIYTFSYLKNISSNTSFWVFFKFLGKNVTTFYVLQWLIIGNLGTVLFQTQDITDWVFWFFIISIVATVLTYLWAKYPMKNTILKKKRISA